jgi:hypothetical protein
LGSIHSGEEVDYLAMLDHHTFGLARGSGGVEDVSEVLRSRAGVREIPGTLSRDLFASGVGGGADALDAQLEFVGVRGARERFIEGDELLGIKIEE